MTRLRDIEKLPHGQRGAVFIWFALLLPVLLVFAALAVDLARLNLTRVELQNAADAGALAGALSITGAGTPTSPYNFNPALLNAPNVAQYTYANGVQVRNVTVVTGFWNLNTAVWYPYTPTPPAGTVPAVTVTIRLSSPRNAGRLRFLFAPSLAFFSPTGTAVTSSDVQVQAIAARQVLNRSVLVQ